MGGDQSPHSGDKHPGIREHPEQRRQEETNREDPTEPRDVGRPPSERGAKPRPVRAA